jgi:hypothetical protein
MGERYSPRILIAPSKAPLRPIPRGLGGLTMHRERYPPSPPGTRVARARSPSFAVAEGKSECRSSPGDRELAVDPWPRRRGPERVKRDGPSLPQHKQHAATAAGPRGTRSANCVPWCQGRDTARPVLTSAGPAGPWPRYGPRCQGTTSCRYPDWTGRTHRTARRPEDGPAPVTAMLSGARTRAVDDRDHGAVRARSAAGLARRGGPTSSCSSQCRVRVWSVRTRARSVR